MFFVVWFGFVCVAVLLVFTVELIRAKSWKATVFYQAYREIRETTGQPDANRVVGNFGFLAGETLAVLERVAVPVIGLIGIGFLVPRLLEHLTGSSSWTILQ
jgi:hypothetical protein